jgi:CxxC motif-containing protein (DUF1111 family)
MRVILKITMAACSLVPVWGCVEGWDEAFGGTDVPRETVVEDLPDLPLPNLSAELQERFDDGDVRFEARFFASQGLGPLYIRQSCASCHQDDARGPGFVETMSALDEAGAVREALFPYGHVIRPFVAGGGLTPVLVPDDDGVLVSRRIGPPVFGRGHLELVSDDAIRAEAARQRAEGLVHGRVHEVVVRAEANPDGFHGLGLGDVAIGRFGVKARIATLDQFTGDAFRGDMGLTNPLYPSEVENPDGLLDDNKAGLDVDLDEVNLVADYVRLLRLPRRALDRKDAEAGAALFAGVGCAACHTPTLATRADHPLAALFGERVAVFTDVLLHDMGDSLADHVADEDASGREWRTAPLMGLRFMNSYLHDGRAQTLDEAVRAHAHDADVNPSDAAAVVDAYRALSDDERAALLLYVEAL